MQEEYIRRGRGSKFKSLLPYESANILSLGSLKYAIYRESRTWVSLMAQQKRLRKLNYN